MKHIYKQLQSQHIKQISRFRSFSRGIDVFRGTKSLCTDGTFLVDAVSCHALSDVRFGCVVFSAEKSKHTSSQTNRVEAHYNALAQASSKINDDYNKSVIYEVIA